MSTKATPETDLILARSAFELALAKRLATADEIEIVEEYETATCVSQDASSVAAATRYRGRRIIRLR